VIVLLVEPGGTSLDCGVPENSPFGVTAVTSYQYVPGWIRPPVVPVVNVGAETTALGRVYEVKIAFETSQLVVEAPPAPVHAAPATVESAAYRLSVYGGPVVVAHHVTGLVSVVPAGYVPAAPPLHPVNDVAVFAVQVTVPEDPSEIVFVPELNLSVAATEIDALGSVTSALSVVRGDEGQYEGTVTVTDEAELYVSADPQWSSRRRRSRATRASC